MRTCLLELLDEMVEPALFDESARRENGVEIGGAAGGEDIGGAGGEVDHGRHAAGRHHREQGDDAAVRGRQHDAERAAFERERHQLPAEHRGRLQQPLIGHLAADRILDRQPVRAMDFCRVDQRFDHGAIGRGGPEDQVRHDRIKRGARGLPPLAALEFRIDLKLDRFKHCDGDLRETSGAAPASA